MTCQEIVELVTEYLEDRMPPEDRAQFEQHLEACEFCRRYIEQMRVTIRTLGRVTPDEQMSPEMKAMVIAAFRDWRTPPPESSG